MASAKVLSNLELSLDLLDEFCTVSCTSIFHLIIDLPCQLDIKEMLVNIMAHILSANSEKVRNKFELRMESDAFAVRYVTLPFSVTTNITRLPSPYASSPP